MRADEGGILDELELPTAQQSEGPTVQEGNAEEKNTAGPKQERKMMQ